MPFAMPPCMRQPSVMMWTTVRWRILLASMVLLAAAREHATGVDAVANSTCMDTFQRLAFTRKEELMRMALSTGKQLPYDAGKYRMCLDEPGTRYLLVSMRISLPSAAPTQMPAELGLCVPDVCSPVDAPDILGSWIAKQVVPALAFARVANVTARSPQTDLQPMGLQGAAAWVVVAALAFLVAASTAAVLVARQSRREGAVPNPEAPGTVVQCRTSNQQLLPARDPSTAGPPLVEGCDQQQRPGARWRPREPPLVAQAFSLCGDSGSLRKLLDVPAYKPTDCLNGLRVLSMAWIILGHTFLMAQAIAGYSNPEDIVQSGLEHNTAEGNPLMFLILSAQSGVDTFFFLSGFLLSMLTLKELRDKSGRLNMVAPILLRYLRLTPSLAFALLVYYKIWPSLAAGPFAPRFQESIANRCENSWWSELTYTMNFVPFDSDKVCMGWTWYLGDDMIFFVLSMGLLPVYHRRRSLGWILAGCACLVSMVVSTWLIVKYHLSVYIFDDHYTKYSYWAYSKPYTRAPAYFVGVMAAWVLETLESRGITRETKPSGKSVQLAACGAAAASFAVLLVLVFIPVTDFGARKNSWSDIVSAMYLVFGRPLWAICWAVIALLCYYGYLPTIDGFLAHPRWVPLARLTYGAYLVHPLMIKLIAGNAQQYYTFSVQDVAYRYLGNVTLAFGGAVVLWVLVERPVMTLTTAATRKPRGRHASRTPAEKADGDPVLQNGASVSNGALGTSPVSR